jgi:hypothetical protein
VILDWVRDMQRIGSAKFGLLRIVVILLVVISAVGSAIETIDGIILNINILYMQY